MAKEPADEFAPNRDAECTEVAGSDHAPGHIASRSFTQALAALYVESGEGVDMIPPEDGIRVDPGGVIMRSTARGTFMGNRGGALHNESSAAASSMNRTAPPGAAALVLRETLARRLFPHDDPIGKRLFQSAHGAWHTVNSVAGDILNSGLTNAPYPGTTWWPGTRPVRHSGIPRVVVRSPLKPEVVARTIRARIAELDPTLCLWTSRPCPSASRI